MSPILRTLNDLMYVLECVALTYTGEAKSELLTLCENIENAPGYAIEGREALIPKLRQALILYKNSEFGQGSSYLSGVSRELWRLYASAHSTHTEVPSQDLLKAAHPSLPGD